MVGPNVRLGTKWLSITSTCTQSALPIRATSAPRSAKSALRMLGVIWMSHGRVRSPSGERPRHSSGSAGGSVPSRLVAVGPLQQRGDVEDVVVDVLVQVAELGEPLRHGEDREVVRVDVVDLVPADRRGDPGVGQAADGVRRGDRVVAGVLVVVDEQVVRVAVLAPPGRRDVVGRAALDLAGEGRARRGVRP